MKPESFLTDEQLRLVQQVSSQGVKILIDGDRSQPTGKSILCDYLNKSGIPAYEAWELEESPEPVRCDDMYLLLLLNKPISMHENRENYPQY